MEKSETSPDIAYDIIVEDNEDVERGCAAAACIMASLIRPRTEFIRRLRIEERTAFRRLSVEEGGCRSWDDEDEDGRSVVDREELVGGS